MSVSHQSKSGMFQVCIPDFFSASQVSGISNVVVRK